MSSMEFAEWQAYYALAPFGDERADIQAALICKVLADINTPKGKAKMPLSDFMLRFGPPEEQSPEAMLSQAEQANVIFGGVDLREDDD